MARSPATPLSVNPQDDKPSIRVFVQRDVVVLRATPISASVVRSPPASQRAALTSRGWFAVTRPYRAMAAGG